MTGTAKTEEVEFEKTYKPKPPSFPPTGCGPAGLGRSGTKPKQLAGRWPTKPPRSTRKDACPRGHHIRGKERIVELSAGRARDSPQPAQRQAGERGTGSEIVAQAGRAGAVTIATNMAA